MSLEHTANQSESEEPQVSNISAPQLTGAELDAKYSIEKRKIVAEDFVNIDDPSEFNHILSMAEEIKDPMAGIIPVTATLKNQLNQMALDLGRAHGLMLDNGTYEGTPRSIVDDIFAKIGNLPSSLQEPYRVMMTKYIQKALDKIKK